MSTPQFPLYIPSKGRSAYCMTMKVLEELGVDYLVVVEEQEKAAYVAALGEHRVIVLPPEYKTSYDTFDRKGPDRPGSGPARNFIWDHSVAAGAEWHWIMDDNIQRFHLRTEYGRVPVLDGSIFRLMEDFVLRYKNVGMAGPNYHMFTPDNLKIPPFYMNTRIYSCNLIRNSLPFRWRGRYNEDTDLSIRILKAGWCTVLFNTFTALKIGTQTMPGGNTDEIYRNGTVDKSKMIYAMHPDITKVKYKFSRVHHSVDYSVFRKLRLIPRDDLPARAGRPETDLKLLHLPDYLPEPVVGRQTREWWVQNGVVEK